MCAKQPLLARKLASKEEARMTTGLDATVAAKELRRWFLWLGGSMIGAAIFTAAALAGLGPWMILPAIIVGPGLGGIALIWLALSSDTNSAASHGVAEPRMDALAAAEPTV
jgi:hypothetical protein